MVSLVAQKVKNLPAMQETRVQSLDREDSWRREWLPIPVFLMGYSPWGHKESDTTERLALQANRGWLGGRGPVNSSY